MFQRHDNPSEAEQALRHIKNAPAWERTYQTLLEAAGGEAEVAEWLAMRTITIDNMSVPWAHAVLYGQGGSVREAIQALNQQPTG